MAWYSNLPWIIAQVAQGGAQAGQAANDAAAGGGLSGMFGLLVAVAILVGSFVVGSLIARGLRMPDYAFRMGLITFSLVASVAICYFGWPPKRGIDLSGGVVLVYEVDTDLSSSNWMQSAIQRVNQRLNAAGGEKLDARPVGDDKIEIVVPDGVDVKGVEEKVAGLRDSADVVLHVESRRTEDGKTIILYRADPGEERRLDMDKLIGAVQRRINPGGVKELTIRRYGAEQLEVIIPEVEEREVEQIKKKISTSGLLEFRIVANPTDDREVIKAAQHTSGRDVYIGGKLAGRWVKADPRVALPPPLATYREAKDGTREVLMRIDPFNVDGRYLTQARPDTDQKGGRAVAFTFNTAGADRFRQFTSRNVPDLATNFYRHLGIVLDNTLLSAPQLNGAIGGQGQITGDFSEDEIKFLVDVLNAGSLPATLRPEPISENRVSAQLGDDTIKAGANAMLISTGAVLLFMLVYYRFAGAVADLAVILNVVITVALMILIKAAFTLPGLAGLVLTVGMAVDANVLIYERMREESARGASLRMTIRNGFSRATATIIDSNVTTLISAVVLYIIGTDQIKGFAVTLILGLLVSMFTAIYVSRVIFDVAEKKRWLTQLKMMQFIGHTNIDFIRWRTAAIAVSAVICAIGLAAAAMRGKELLDIDFTGGSSVQLVFDDGKEQTIAQVREAVGELPDVAVSSVGDKNLAFKIDTSDGDVRHVQQFLQKKLGDSLRTYQMSFGELAIVEPPKEDAEKDAGAAKDEAGPVIPSETPKPEEKPAAEEKPAEEKPAEEEKPAAEKPAEDAKPAESPEGEAPKSSTRLRAGVRTLELASASDELAVLALLQETPEAKPDEAKPASDPPPTEGAAEKEKSAEQPAAEKTETPAEKPEESKPAETATDAKPSDAAGTEPGATPVDGPEQGAAGSLVGGTRVMLTFQEEIAHEPLRELIQNELDAAKLREATFRLTNPLYQPGSEADYKEWTLEMSLKPEDAKQVLAAVQKQLTETPVFPSSSEIGGKVAGDTQLMALYAMLASMVMIVVYVWIRFQNLVFGIAAVLAVVHDVLVATACLALSAFIAPYTDFLLVDPFKISLPVVAALLTIVGFSINDTIVIFDRIREVRGKSPDLTPEMINLSVNQTLSRTFLTSGTVLISSVILYVVGGAGIHAFAFTMVVGVIAGTYSSVYIAAPILLWMRKPVAKPPAKSTTAMPAGAGGK